MSNKEAYQKVIKLIMDEELDYYQVVRRMALEDPETLLRFVGENGMSLLDKIKNWVDANDMYDKRIEVIKEVRKVTGWGLREAKDWVDEHWTHLEAPF